MKRTQIRCVYCLIMVTGKLKKKPEILRNRLISTEYPRKVKEKIFIY